MSWLTNVVLPKIRAVVARKAVPDNLWHKCPGCEQMLFYRELEANLHVCRNCGHHLRIGAERRLKLLFDDGAFTRIELPRTPVDPLRFRDSKRYTDRLKEGQAALGPRSDAVAVAHGYIGGVPAVVAAFEFSFMGGSMGIAAGEAILAAAKLAVLQEAALIVVPASGGARMQEGVLSLVQMPRTIIAAETVKEAGLPYIVVLTDPTTGGVSASFAMVGDITLAEPGAVIGFAANCVVDWQDDDAGQSFVAGLMSVALVTAGVFVWRRFRPPLGWLLLYAAGLVALLVPIVFMMVNAALHGIHG